MNLGKTRNISAVCPLSALNAVDKKKENMKREIKNLVFKGIVNGEMKTETLSTKEIEIDGILILNGRQEKTSTKVCTRNGEPNMPVTTKSLIEINAMLGLNFNIGLIKAK